MRAPSRLPKWSHQSFIVSSPSGLLCFFVLVFIDSARRVFYSPKDSALSPQSENRTRNGRHKSLSRANLVQSLPSRNLVAVLRSARQLN